MKKSIFFLAAVVVAVTSCKTPSYNVKDYQYTDFRETKVDQPSLKAALQLVDLKVSPERITYAERILDRSMYTGSKLFKGFPSKNDVATYRGFIIEHAAAAHNADLLVAPVVSIVTEEDGHLIMKVTGYPAVYTNFRNVTKADAELYRLLNFPSAETTIIVDEVKEETPLIPEILPARKSNKK